MRVTNSKEIKEAGKDLRSILSHLHPMTQRASINKDDLINLIKTLKEAIKELEKAAKKHKS